MADVIMTAQLPETTRMGNVAAGPQGKSIAVRFGYETALGAPLLAAFIPVRREGGKWIPIDSNGDAKPLAEVGWAQGADPVDEMHAQFTVSAPAQRWDAPVPGVLVVLVYEQPEGPPNNQNIQGQYRTPRKGLIPSSPTPIKNLPPSIGAETQAKLDTLLASQPADKLARGVTRLPPV